MPDSVVIAMASAGDRYYYCQHRFGYENLYYLKISQGDTLTTSLVASLNAPVVAIACLGRDGYVLIKKSATEITLARISGEPFATTFEEIGTFEEREDSPANRPIAATSSLVYFVLYPATGGATLWRTDGTSAGTIAVCETNGQGPNHLVVFNDQVVFQAEQKAKKPKPQKKR
jgi:ELWxxDGT repeat protein